jgi:hypothetical protein
MTLDTITHAVETALLNNLKINHLSTPWRLGDQCYSGNGEETKDYFEPRFRLPSTKISKLKFWRDLTSFNPK